MKKKFINVAIESALEAGSYARKRKGKIKRISFKGDINLVTDVDSTCEDIIVNRIQKNFPSHSILAEESHRKISPAEYRWIIDPLDGTTNYSRNLPIYSVSIALEHLGRPIVGVVYDPERDELFKAEIGKGAYLNKKRIRTSKTRLMKHAFLVTGFAYNIRLAKRDNMEYFKTFVKKALAVRRLGSAALDLSYVACGRFDGFWEMNLQPWDCAAGVLIVKEAGGRITKFDESPFSYYDNELVATNSRVHKQMIKILKK